MSPSALTQLAATSGSVGSVKGARGSNPPRAASSAKAFVQSWGTRAKTDLTNTVAKLGINWRVFAKFPNRISPSEMGPFLMAWTESTK